MSNRNYLLICFLLVAVLAQFIVDLVYFAQIYNFVFVVQLASAVNTIRAWNAVSSFTDILIAAVLSYLLLTHRSGFERTNSIVNRLIMYTVGTGLVTGLCAVAALISSLVKPESFLYIFIDMIISKRKLLLRWDKGRY